MYIDNNLDHVDDFCVYFGEIILYNGRSLMEKS